MDSQTQDPKNPSPDLTKRSRGRPKIHGLTGTGTYGSYKAAKNRCTNPKDRQYRDYGGRGIKFLLGSVEELVADIGKRPVGHSLDRIDPNGHYAPGNLRWATPQVQAKNRRGPNFYSEKAVRERWCSEYQDRCEKRNTHRRWALSIKTFDWQLEDAELDELTELCSDRRTPYATFELNDPRDVSYPDPGFIRLPSLTVPFRDVVLRGGPFGKPMQHLVGRGFISGMSMVSLNKNCTNSEIEICLSVLSGSGHRSVCYTGGDWTSNHIPIEGRLMAMAAAITNHRAARLVPVVQLEADLLADKTEHLLEGCLVIPDLHVNRPAFGLDRQLRDVTLQILKERLNRRLPTLIFAEDPIRLGRELALFFEAHYRIVELQNLPARSTPHSPLLNGDIMKPKPVDGSAINSSLKANRSESTTRGIAGARSRGTVWGNFGPELASRNKNGADAFAEQLRPVLLELLVTGYPGPTSIADELNRRGVASRSGGLWYPHRSSGSSGDSGRHSRILYVNRGSADAKVQ